MSAVEELSRRKGEPNWMLQKRLHAWDIYEHTEAPLGRRGDLGTFRTMANFKYAEIHAIRAVQRHHFTSVH